ncbi:DUF2284 domain-containing protein [Desulfolucanica intricata]|uniref:DUF2284 domain-containing protein n=1 Tax=Desulfolucanica intricata TaxID=1285191 RepID=UPI00083645F6|nr:DUF2284 domain-containing protein [Desulfolucanica intricata]
MYETVFKTKTPSSEILINIKIVQTLSNNLIQYENKNFFNKLCKNGCPNFNHKWSCPPYSPLYSEYSKEYSNAMLVLLFCTLNQFYYIKTEYMKVKASNSILKSKMDKFMRWLEPVFNGKILSNGSCRLCKLCTCKDKTGNCKKPKEMRYSMESVGLDVEKISLHFLNHKFLWYKNKKAPLYSSVVSCLLTPKPVNINSLISQLENITL